MARIPVEDSIYRVSVHRNGDYLYASTHPYEITPEGKRKYRYYHWGTLTERMKFIPGKNYLEASPEIRSKLVFPKDWDLSVIRGNHIGGLPFFCSDKGKLFGNVFLMEAVATSLGLKDDLFKALGGSSERVNDILTLAYFPYLTGYGYSRLEMWQRITKTPSDKTLDESAINRIVSEVSMDELSRLMELRSSENQASPKIVVDSISRSAYGESLADQKWGQKKARLHLRQTVEFVVYDSSDNLPVHYMTIPGGVQDSLGLEQGLSSLRKKGFGDTVLVSDRGYESLANLDRFILGGQKMVLCVNVSQPFVYERIEEVSRSGILQSLDSDPAPRRFSTQFDLVYTATDAFGQAVPVTGMKLNVFYNPSRRMAELKELDLEIATQGESLKAILSDGGRLDDDKAIRRNYSWYNIIYDSSHRRIKSFVLNQDKVARTRMTSGFFANVTVGLDKSASEAMNIYSLKYDQEKLLQQLRAQMDFENRFSQTGVYGLHMILLLDLILGNCVRGIWSSGELRQLSRSPMGLFDIMQPLLCEDDGSGICTISSMNDQQRHICELFSISLPKK